MLLALTVERYVSVCHPSYTRPLMGPPHVTVALIPVATFLMYLPSVFRGEITHCLLGPTGPLIYQKRDNTWFLHSLFYSVSATTNNIVCVESVNMFFIPYIIIRPFRVVLNLFSYCDIEQSDLN